MFRITVWPPATAWLATNAPTSTTQTWIGTNTVTAAPLGIYQQILNCQQQQQAIWTAVSSLATSPHATTSAQYWTYQQAFDVPMPDAAARVRGISATPALIHAGRRAVRRSIDLYLRFRPEAELRRFIAGEQVNIQGWRMRYVVQKTVGIMAHTMRPVGGHTPYRLRMIDPAGGHSISGCVYLNDTPVLDQVLALILHVNDPDGELRLIRNTNWSPRLPPHIQRLLEYEQRIAA